MRSGVTPVSPRSTAVFMTSAVLKTASRSPNMRMALAVAYWVRAVAGVRVSLARPESTKDRKSVVEGKSVSVRVDLGGRSIIKKKRREHASGNTRELPIEKYIYYIKI